MHAKHDPLAKETPQAYEIWLETTRELFYRAKSRPGVYHAVKDVSRSRCEREQLQLALRSIDMWLEKLDLYKGFANWLRCDQMVYAQDHFCEGVTHGLDPLASSINRERRKGRSLSGLTRHMSFHFKRKPVTIPGNYGMRNVWLTHSSEELHSLFNVRKDPRFARS